MKYLFPINYTALEKYKNISNVFKKELCSKYSSKQIFRLLDNLHYDSIEKLVELIEELLSETKVKGFIYKKLNSTDFLTFESNLNELQIYNLLINNGFEVITFDDNKRDVIVPEYYAFNETYHLLIELYSPKELFGFNIFLNELQTAIKYYPGDFGFNCIYDFKSLNVGNDLLENTLLPFKLNSIFSNDRNRRDMTKKITETIFDNIAKQNFSNTIEIAKNITISFKIIFNDDYDNRSITYTTPGYNSVIKFMNLDSTEYKTKGFYKKLLTKINKGQLNIDLTQSVLKILFIDFTYSMGSDVLVEGIGKDFLSETFYNNFSKCLRNDVSEKKLNLIIPVVFKKNNNLFIGNPVFNPLNMDISEIFNLF